MTLSSLNLTPEAVQRLTGRPADKPLPGRKSSLSSEQITRIRTARVASETLACEVGVSRRYVDLIRDGKRIAKKFQGKLTCPFCGQIRDQSVVDCRGDEHGGRIHRRRVCACGRKFTTVETIA